jgi:hypothetical protein
LGHSNELDPKISKKLPLRWNKKRQVDFENLEGPNNEAKRNVFRQNIEKRYVT